MDITKSTIPILLAMAIGVFGFTVGSSLNSSVKDIQNLQTSVASLGVRLESVQQSLNTQNSTYLTQKDLQIFCLTLVAANKGLRCSIPTTN